MSDDDMVPSVASQPSACADGTTDDGRRYWKAAIAHLAPEKREAAWEFYLDRLESSAAADTLGGVMLLLEAHLAFFDDLPARLGLAAQQIEAAVQTPGQPNIGGGSPPSIAKRKVVSASRGRWSAFLRESGFTALGGVLVGGSFLFLGQRGAHGQAEAAARASRFLFTRANSIRVEPWNDPKTHHEQGVVISFGSVAWTERTSSGGANVYVLSPVEEVRRDLEALRQTPR